ncbi:MAG: GNAT family N-acetyltransferase [Sphingobium sp.]|nr:GNAT family N-acetyltransferase [Sphingobium sp.]MCP5399761.1 GNAT family N-acetyltransferase [Sphingomonas sp.]
MHFDARFEHVESAAALEPRWRAVEAQAGEDASFFLRWTWMGSWLAALENAGIALPQLLAMSQDGQDRALALIGEGRARRRLGSVPATWLNESGSADGNRPFIEYNGLLCAKADKPAAVHAFGEAMGRRQDWRVFHLSGLEFGTRLPDLPGIRRKKLRDASPSYYVDLNKVYEAGGDYLSLLSANTRSQIKRSLKDEPGNLTLERAEDEASIDHWLGDMARLNQGRHVDNAWDNGFFRDFVKRITHAGLADGTVELLRVASGDEEPVGYLVNFVWAGRAMNYQSAFASPRTAKSKPGLMCHAAAVTRYADAGLSRYSLLAGKDRYKHSLSTGAEELNWWALERFDWRLEIEAAARRLFAR